MDGWKEGDVNASEDGRVQDRTGQELFRTLTVCVIKFMMTTCRLKSKTRLRIV